MKIVLDVFISDAGKDLFRIWRGGKTAASIAVRCSFDSRSMQLRICFDTAPYPSRDESVVRATCVRGESELKSEIWWEDYFLKPLLLGRSVE